MPYRNKNKKLFEDGIYHAYNRGIQKMEIFKDLEDYRKFIDLIRKYIDPTYEWMITGKIDKKLLKELPPDKFRLYRQVDLHAFCLMPNHFHLLATQKVQYSLSKLLGVVESSYTRYFNSKYQRVGRLWEDTYKAVIIKNEKQYINVLDYIHENPAELGINIKTYEFSSLQYYLDRHSYSIVKKGLPFKKR